ncbi:hypothetical protein F2Q70_00030246 [Brassica cretica]|uniref:Asn/Gln amidotransferase domain-containing protein n=1 Tax=Brassica cretica TaxID=69181 RepID=A0A8S9FC98_BRACR|nr:hypothetical protein F2Q70_00030246 [Brassica cretica]
MFSLNDNEFGLNNVENLKYVYYEFDILISSQMVPFHQTRQPQLNLVFFVAGRTRSGVVAGAFSLQITDPVEMEKMVMKVFSKSPKQLEQYRSGRTKLQGFFCWPGKANPALLNKILLEKLNAKE